MKFMRRPLFMTSYIVLDFSDSFFNALPYGSDFLNQRKRPLENCVLPNSVMFTFACSLKKIGKFKRCSDH